MAGGSRGGGRNDCCARNAGSNLGRWRGSESGIVGAMEASIASGEAANALVIGELELGLEQRDGPFFGWTEAPLLCGACQQACFCKS